MPEQINEDVAPGYGGMSTMLWQICCWENWGACI